MGQGETKENAIEKLKEAIGSFGDVCKEESEVYTAPLSIKALHEFLTVEGKEPASESYELRAVYA